MKITKCTDVSHVKSEIQIDRSQTICECGKFLQVNGTWKMKLAAIYDLDFYRRKKLKSA